MVERFADAFAVVPVVAATVKGALQLVGKHRFEYWDAMIATAAAEAGCSMLLSEDMQHGFTIHGLTIVNPRIEPPHPRLAALL